MVSTALTVDELLGLPSSRFTDLIAFFELEPFGVTRDNMHTAQQSAILHKILAPKSSRTADAFMWRDPGDPKTTRQKSVDFVNDLLTLAK